MSIELMTEVVEYDIKRSAGGVEFSGTFHISPLDALIYDSGDDVWLYIGNTPYGEALLRGKEWKRSKVKFVVSSIDLKYLKRFVVDSIDDNVMYSAYINGLNFNLHWLSNTESVTASTNNWVILSKRNIKPNSEAVTSSDGTVLYVNGTDYKMDYESGRIYIYGSGSIADASTIVVTYGYYENVDVVDIVKYVIEKHVGMDYVVDDFEILDDNGNRVRLDKYNVNDYVIDALKKLANVVGARVFVNDNVVYFLVSTYNEVSTTYDNSFVIYDKWRYDPDKIVNDIHVFGKEFTNSQVDTFAGDGVNTTFKLSKIPRDVDKVEINISGEWTQVPYTDPNTGDLRYEWSVDYEKGKVIFKEPPPVSPSISDPILLEYPDWHYMNKITITNPNSVDVTLVGKLIIDNSSSDGINDFKWDAVKEDGSDIVIATVDANGNILEIPYKFYSWEYGTSAEVWFGGTMSDGNTFIVPANSSVDIYLLYGNPNAVRTYTWSDVGVVVYIDTTGKFVDVDYAGYLIYDGTPYVDEGYGIEYGGSFDYFSLDDVYKLDSYINYFDPVSVYAYLTMPANTNGEVIFTISRVVTDINRAAAGVVKIASDGTQTLILGNANTGRFTFSTTRIYISDSVISIRTSADKTNSTTSADYLEAYTNIKMWVLRPDGALECTYSINAVVENLYNNIKVSYKFSAPLYYNLQKTSSIDRFGIRSKNVTLNWVTDREALKNYASKYLNAYSEPLYIGTMKMSLADYISKYFVVGNVINVVDAHDNIDGKFLVDKIRISNGVVEAEIIQLPSDDTGIIGLLYGTVLFDVDQSSRLRTLEVGNISSIINIM